MSLIALILYFLHIECKQFYKDPKDYFSSPWNLSDLININLCLMVMSFDIIDISKEVQRPLSSITVILLWIKLFYFLRIYDSTTRLIRMIIEIFKDMQNFLIVLFIGIFGFSAGFYILSEGDVNSEKKNFAGTNIF